MSTTIQQRIEELKEQLNRWSHEYYVEDKPTATDAEYDKAYHELVALEVEHPEFVTPDSPTQTCGWRSARPVPEGDAHESNAQPFKCFLKRRLGRIRCASS